MSWKTRYNPPQSHPWQGRPDTPAASCLFQIIELLDLQNASPKKSNAPAFALLGFCCDEGVRRNLGRTGAAEAPTVLRNWLAKLPIQKQPLICYDAGNITCTDADLEGAQKALAEVVTLLLKHNIAPIVIGGGHEMAWGHYQGIAQMLPQENISIVNFDAHFDMRPLLPQQHGSSGTPFLQIANAMQAAQKKFDYTCIGIQQAGNTRQLFETAQTWQVQTIFADELHQQQTEKCKQLLQRLIEQQQTIYVSLCLDVFAAAYAPGVSAPQAMGLTPWQVLPFMRQLAASGKVISYDIAELAPKYDKDDRTAKLAANFVFEIIHHHRPKG